MCNEAYVHSVIKQYTAKTTAMEGGAHTILTDTDTDINNAE